MTDETLILLETLAIQLYESEIRSRGYAWPSWGNAMDGLKQSYRDDAFKWFESAKAAKPSDTQAWIFECPNCKGHITDSVKVCPCGLTKFERG